MDVVANILKNISSCCCLLLRDVIIGILKEGMDLVNYVIILGKAYLWSCRHKEIKPSGSHFKKILENKYELKNILHLNPIELFLFAINGETMKSCFKVAITNN